MMKKMIVALICTMMATTTVSAATGLNVVTYESCDLTPEILTTRAERHEIIIDVPTTLEEL